MRKIYKAWDYVPSNTAPIKLDNSIKIPNQLECEITDDDIAQKKAEEELKQQEKEKLEALERERAFAADVSAEVARIVSIKMAEIEAERAEIIDNATKLVTKMTTDAKISTTAIIERANKECAILRDKAIAEGYAKGEADARAEFLEKTTSQIESVEKLLCEINAHKNAYYVSNERELRDTLFLMVEKITKQELATKPAIIENIISDAAKNFRNSDYIKISLADGEISRKLKTDGKLIREIIPYAKDVDIEILYDADEGTVILDNNSEIVDASVPTQLDFLKEILKSSRGEE